MGGSGEDCCSCPRGETRMKPSISIVILLTWLGLLLLGAAAVALPVKVTLTINRIRAIKSAEEGIYGTPEPVDAITVGSAPSVRYQTLAGAPCPQTPARAEPNRLPQTDSAD